MQKELRNFLNKHKRLKKYLKFVALYTFCLFGFVSNFGNRLKTSTARLPGHSFFGYYDKNPQNEDGLVISHHLLNEYDTEIEIWLLDANLTPLKLLTKSKAWNFQQGSRCHWISKSVVILNDVIDGRILSKSVDIHTDDIIYYHQPVHDSDAEGKTYVTTNFMRTTRLQPEYGYTRAVCSPTSRDDTNEELGLATVEISSGKVLDSCSIRDVASLLNKNDILNALINHVMVSPSGKKLMFIYREVFDNYRLDSLLTCNLDLSEMKVILSDTIVSHMAWVSDEQVIGYFEECGYQGYQFLNMHSFNTVPIIELSEFTDGHPTFCASEAMFFDTYPNIFGLISLFKYNYKSSATLVYQNYHPPKYRDDHRCDLHPRYSPFTDSIFIDTIINGKRTLARV